jgi:hypothetical protein
VGSGSSFAVSNTNGPALLAASPTFTVTASTTSAANNLIVDNAGPGIAPAAIGGNKVAVQAQTAWSADQVSGAVTAGTLVFNFVTAVPVPVGGKIIVNLPYNYLQAQMLTALNVANAVLGSCPVVNVAANPTACPPVTASATITCTVTTAALPAGAHALSFSAGWKSGDPAVTVTGGYTVVTTLASGSTIEGPAETGATLTAFIKGALAVAPTFAFSVPGDLNAQVSATTGTLTLGFKTVNKVVIGNAFVLTTPLNYFRTLGFTSSTGTHAPDGTTWASGTAACTKTTATSTTTNDVWTCITSVGQMSAETAVTWTSAAGSWSVLNNQAAGIFSVMTQTAAGFVIDSAISSAAGGAPAIVGAPGTISVGAITFSVPTDTNPGLTTTTGTLTIAGITSSTTLQAYGSVLVFTFPYQYIRATSATYTTIGGLGATGVCTTVDTAPIAACPPATGTAGFTTMTCTATSTQNISAATPHSLIISAGQNWRMASNTASGTFTLQAMSVNSGIISVVSSPQAVVATGGTVTAVAAAANSVTGDKLPGITTTGVLVLGLNPASSLSIGSTIVFTLPANYLSTAAGVMAGATISTAFATVSCTLTQAFVATACAAAGTTSTISCVTGGAVIPSGTVTAVTFAAGSWSLAKGATGTYTAATFNNLGNLLDRMSPPSALVTATASGAVSNVQAAVFSAATDQVPGLATTTGTLSFTFTTATTIPSGVIAIKIQSQYLNTVGAFTTMMGSTSAVGPSGHCSIVSSTAAQCAISASVATCGESQAAQGALQFLACSFTSSLTAGVVTLSLTAGTYTVGSAQPASMYTVSTGTSFSVDLDAASTTFGTLPALAAGAVSAVSTAAFSVLGDMVPGTLSTGTLTFGFTTATDLPSGALVQVALPVGYLSAVTSGRLGTGLYISCALGSLTQGCPPTSNQLMTCTTTAAVPKGAQSLVLQIGGFVVGTKNAAAGTSYSVMTSTAATTAFPGGIIIDTAGSGTVPSIAAGGTASGNGIATASVAADMIPGTATVGTLSLAFTTSTILRMAIGKIVFSLTPGYLRTAGGATLTGGSPPTTSTCSALTLTSSGSKQAPAIGGAITAFTVFTPSSTVPATAAATVSVAFTVQRALPNGAVITITMPAGYFSAITAGAVTSTTGITANVGGVFSSTATQILLTLQASIGANTAVAFTINGVTIGPRTLAVTNGICVNTPQDVSACRDAVQIGGAITAFTVFTPSSVVPGEAGQTISIAFKLATALANGDTIIITMPSGYISALIGGANSVTGIAATATAITSTVSTITLIASAALIPSSVQLTINGVTMGTGPVAINGICVSTDKDVSACRDSVQIGGSITQFTVFTPSSTVPATAAATVSVAFTLQSALSNGAVITITMPSGYFSAIAAGSVTSTTGITANVGGVFSSTATQILLTLSSAIGVNTAVAFTINGVTIGPRTLAVTNGICVNTPQDVSACRDAPQIGGTITAFTTFTPSSVIPGEAAQTVSVAFTVQNPLPNGAIITITMPAGYFSAITAGAVTGTTGITANVGAITAGTLATQILLTLTVPITVANTAVAFTIPGVTMSTIPMLAVPNGISINTPLDAAATANAPAIGGQVTLISVTPSSNTPSTLTLEFQLATKVLNGGSMTLTYPSAYIASGVTPTLAASTSFFAIVGATSAVQVVMTATAHINSGTYTVTLSGLTLGAISAATCQYFSLSTSSDLRSIGCSAAVADTITCTVGTANLAAGSYNLVLTAGQWSFGPAQPAGTFSVLTTQNNIVLDAAAATTGALPQIGGTVAVTSFAAVNAADLQKVGWPSTGVFAIGFTTSTALTANSFIQFTLPAANYFQSLGSGPPTLTGQSFTAPTCSLSSTTVLKCVFNALLPSGSSTISLAAGWVPGATVNSAQFPTNANFNKATYTISNLRTPSKRLPAATYAAATSNYQACFANNECSATISFPTFGAQVTGVSFTIADADRVPAATGKAVTVVFTIATALVATDTITVSYPSGFIGTAAVTAAPTTLTASTPGAASLVLTVAADASFAADTSITVTLAGATMGGATAGSATGITVGPTASAQGVSKDLVSAGVASGSIRGRVSILTSLSLVTADRVGGLPTFGVVSIVFRPDNAIPAGGTITINTPYNYFATRAAISSVGSSSAITCASIACPGVVVGDIAVSNTAAAGSQSSYGSITVVIGGGSTSANVPITLMVGPSMLTTGMSQAATTNGITVSTALDASAGAESLALLSEEEFANLPPTTSSPSQACPSSNDDSGPNIVGLSFSTGCASKDGPRSCFMQSTSLITGNALVAL